MSIKPHVEPVREKVSLPQRRKVKICIHCGSEDVFVQHTRPLFYADPNDPMSELVPVSEITYTPNSSHSTVIERYWKCMTCCKTGKSVVKIRFGSPR